MWNNLEMGFPAPPFGTTGRRPEPRPSVPGSNSFQDRDTTPKRGGHHPFGELRRPNPTPKPREDGPRPQPSKLVQRHKDEYTKRVRRFTLQKMIKKFEGSRDPHDHVASFKQVVCAEQVSDQHTQIEGFGLTLEGKSLSWF